MTEKITIEYECNNKNEALHLELFEESLNNKDKVMIKVLNKEIAIEIEHDTFFEALTELRLILEKKDIILRCNGTAINVFPSPMILSMGEGRLAYKCELGIQATREDLVDIFEVESQNMFFCKVDEQILFHNKWLNSLKRGESD